MAGDNKQTLDEELEALEKEVENSKEPTLEELFGVNQEPAEETPVEEEPEEKEKTIEEETEEFFKDADKIYEESYKPEEAPVEEEPELEEAPEEKDPIFNGKNKFFDRSGKLLSENEAKQSLDAHQKVGVLGDNNATKVISKDEEGKISSIDIDGKTRSYAYIQGMAALGNPGNLKSQHAKDMSEKIRDLAQNNGAEAQNLVDLGKSMRAYAEEYNKTENHTDEEKAEKEKIDKFAKGIAPAIQHFRFTRAADKAREELQASNEKEAAPEEKAQEEPTKEEPTKEEPTPEQPSKEPEEKESPVKEEPQSEADKQELSARGQVLKDLDNVNAKKEKVGLFRRLLSAILPNNFTEYGKLRSRADTLNKMQYFAGQKGPQTAGGDGKQAPDPYGYMKMSAFNRYMQLNEEYHSIGLLSRLISRILPDEWTHAGRCRKYMGMCNRLMKGDSGLNPYTKEEYGGDKNADGSEKTAGEKAIDGYKNRYNSLSNEYNKLSTFQRFMSHVLPNGWTKGGQLRDKIAENDEAMKDLGFNKDDLENIKDIENEKTENKLVEEPTKEETEQVMEASEKDVSPKTKEKVAENIKEAEATGKFPDEKLLEETGKNLNHVEAKTEEELEAKVEEEVQGKNGAEEEKEKEQENKEITEENPEKQVDIDNPHRKPLDPEKMKEDLKEAPNSSPDFVSKQDVAELSAQKNMEQTMGQNK